VKKHKRGLRKEETWRKRSRQPKVKSGLELPEPGSSSGS
jgi:hypothetical protein